MKETITLLLRGLGATAEPIGAILNQGPVGRVISSIANAAADAIELRNVSPEDLIAQIQRAQPLDLAWRDDIDRQVADLP